ncbi:MAG: DUF6498-containing protein, partial [Verrucomicrobiota bacterium]
MTRILTSLVLVLANLIPLYGVFAWEWRVFDIVLVYWIENLIVGLFNVARILFARAPAGAPGGPRGCLAPFFVVHYGIFCTVHGVFVFTLLGGGSSPSDIEQELVSGWLGLSVAALFISHLVSFVFNFLIRGEGRDRAPAQQMFAPYGRIVVLHLAILFGAF